VTGRIPLAYLSCLMECFSAKISIPKAYAVAAIELEFDEVQKTFETNVISVMRIVQTFSTMLIKSKGTIVNIGTLNPDMPFAFLCRSSFSSRANLN
jgi:NAD(P)-dependent dehydrogenase (short-subunit alcohol dehydrogenase family)